MIVHLPYPEYIEVMRRPDGKYRFIFSKVHRNNEEVKSLKSLFVDLKISDMPDNVRSRVNMLRMRPNNSYLEELGAVSENWMCVRIEEDELRQIRAMNTGHEMPKTTGVFIPGFNLN